MHNEVICMRNIARIFGDAKSELCKTLFSILKISAKEYYNTYKTLKQDRKFSVILDNIDKNKQLKHNDMDFLKQL